jgi:hypothetical protein
MTVDRDHSASFGYLHHMITLLSYLDSFHTVLHYAGYTDNEATVVQLAHYEHKFTDKLLYAVGRTRVLRSFLPSGP